MSLATRCPACATVFRVVSDQLKVSEGWVRCGRCSEVFDAGQRLFELEPEGATPALEPAATPASATPPPEAVPGQPEAAHDLPSNAHALERPSLAIDAAVEPTVESTAEEAAAADTPGFVQRADRAARWRQPARRGGMAVLSLLLAALLAAQIALHYRDGLAAGWPAARPWLQGACTLLGCQIEAPRRIDSLSVDSSGLVRVDGSALYRLSLVVHNKAPNPVRMPAFDLSLTDAQGQPVARRVLMAHELGHTTQSLPGRAELPLQATLELGDRQVAGYTIELFYP
ncbi:MAG: DUF3426 domain-containing protein [Rubrivivax sp.]